MSLTNNQVFAGNPLDRVSNKRVDKAWVRAQQRDSGSRILPFRNGQPFILAPEKEGDPYELGFIRPGLIEPRGGTVLFLGVDDKDVAHFAIDISHKPDPTQGDGPLNGFGEFEELRGIVMQGRLLDEDASIAAQAKAMLEWHSTHKYCSKCGKDETVPADGGYKRVCEDCDAEHFPRTDPVIITIAIKGDRALLGRGKNFPKGMFSALAGFVEPGETIEEATARELFEEAGIVTTNVRYHASQPWPFPMTLMIGTIAQADTEEISLENDDELAEARWFTKEELRSALAGKADFFVPPPFAIAHHLIKAFVESD